MRETRNDPTIRPSAPPATGEVRGKPVERASSPLAFVQQRGAEPASDALVRDVAPLGKRQAVTAATAFWLRMQASAKRADGPRGADGFHPVVHEPAPELRPLVDWMHGELERGLEGQSLATDGTPPVYRQLIEHMQARLQALADGGAPSYAQIIRLMFPFSRAISLVTDPRYRNHFKQQEVVKQWMANPDLDERETQDFQRIMHLAPRFLVIPTTAGLDPADFVLPVPVAFLGMISKVGFADIAKMSPALYLMHDLAHLWGQLERGIFSEAMLAACDDEQLAARVRRAAATLSALRQDLAGESTRVIETVVAVLFYFVHESEKPVLDSLDRQELAAGWQRLSDEDRAEHLAKLLKSGKRFLPERPDQEPLTALEIDTAIARLTRFGAQH